MVPDRIMRRLAARLADAWSPPAGGGTVGEAWPLLESAWERLRRAQRRAAFAESHRLAGVLPGCVEEVRAALRYVAFLAEQEERFAASPPAASPPAFADWLADLRQLEEEFGEIKIDLRAGTLTVVTEPVELQGIELGPFALVCTWAGAGIPKAPHFEVVALAPNRPTGRHDVTHPHVQNDAVCLGEAQASFAAALAAGRLADCCALLRGVLANYNPDSAYVELDLWDGVRCGDCGSTVERDATYSCDGCDGTVCCDCLGSCKVCGTDRCPGCLASCAACNESVCPACLAASATPRRRVCPDCLRPCAECGRKFGRDELTAAKRCPGCDGACDADENEGTEADLESRQPTTEAIGNGAGGLPEHLPEKEEECDTCTRPA